MEGNKTGGRQAGAEVVSATFTTVSSRESIFEYFCDGASESWLFRFISKWNMIQKQCVCMNLFQVFWGALCLRSRDGQVD